MSDCPSCGRYVGPYEACPYCGAHITGRVPVRVVKIAAVILATVGLLTLWFAAVRSQIPLIQVSQAGATMNMAYVRVEGRVVRGPVYYPDSGYLAFTVDDTTGEIRVSAYRKEVDTLRAEGRIPALGDQVRVAGTLRVREEDAALTLNVPDQLEIVRPEPEDRQIGSIGEEDHLTRVRVRGQVWEVRVPYEGLTLISVRDSTGVIDVAVDQSLESLTGALLPVEPGQSVEVVGAVGLYRDTPQIVPASVMDIRLLAEPVAVALEARVGELTTGDAGRMVTVEGDVTGVDPFSAGVKFTLDDGTGEVTVLLWQDVYDGLEEPAALAAGARVRVMGELSVYRGALEVIPERSVDVELLQAGTGEEQVAQVPLGDLSGVSLGETVAVEGEVVGVASFSGGFKLTLEDGTGQVVLLLWLSVFDELPGDPPRPGRGAVVRAVGELDEYEGELQVVPASGSDVTVTAVGTVQVPRREIGSLSGSDVGSEVAVEGDVSRTDSFSGGYRVWVRDGTGEVMVLLWDNVYERVPDREGLLEGAQLYVVGVVEEYEGELEIIPQWPYDVVVGEGR